MLKYGYLKSLIDMIGAFTLLLVLSPIILIFGMLVKVEDPSGTVFFRQERIGKNNKAFVLYKLRSMKIDSEENSHLTTDEERMLKIGKLIRQTSIDELPQLINVLKGEMSFIGPRPLLVEYLPYYTDRESRRHSVKPGISGWAQVNGRTSVTWERKFDLDVEYVEKCSLLFDIRIVMLTLKKVIEGSDIIESGQETNQDLVQYRLNQQNN